jgi:hypothetical protein
MAAAGVARRSASRQLAQRVRESAMMAGRTMRDRALPEVRAAV